MLRMESVFAGQHTVSRAVIYLTPKWLARIQRVHPQTRRPALASGMSSVLHRSCLWPSGTGGPHHCRSIRNAGAGLQWSTAAPHYSYPSLLAAPLGARSCHGMGALWVSLYQVCPWHASPPKTPSQPIPSHPSSASFSSSVEQREQTVRMGHWGCQLVPAARGDIQGGGHLS